MTKLAVIFNTCGVSRRENVSHYISAINSILNQDFDDFHVVLSSCMNSQAVQQEMVEEFGDRLFYNFINELVPVPVSFNHSVQKYVENVGAAEGYLYVDSGCSFPDPQTLKKLYELHDSGPYGMTAALTNTDTGLWEWFGYGRYGNDLEGIRARMFENDKHFIVPIGKTINLHCQIFSEDLRSFYGKCYTDIFAGQCSESVFSFINAALSLKFVVHKDLIVDHKVSMDGASSGFLPHSWVQRGNRAWDHPFGFSGSIVDRIKDGQTYGLGYEELQRILTHDPDQFSEEGFCRNNELKHFIKDRLFLQPNEYDYTTLNAEWWQNETT
jgi:hypothetical protein